MQRRSFSCNGPILTQASERTASRWLQRTGRHPAGPVLLFFLAVAEATVFPAPTEAMLMALSMAAPRRTRWWTAIATVGSVGGGVIGYAAGAALDEVWMEQALAWSGSGEWLTMAGNLYRENHAVALITSGFTPVPYLVYTISAGAAGIPLPAFVAFSLIGRGLKYSVVGGLGMVIGPAVLRCVDRLGARGAVAVVIALIAAYLVLRG